MKYTRFYLFGVLALVFTACQSGEEEWPSLDRPEKVVLQGKLTSEKTITRAVAVSEVLDDTHGTIYVHQLASGSPGGTGDTAHYIIRSGYYGTLEPLEKGLDWDDRTTDMVFHAWTMPEGVGLQTGSLAEGEIDFNTKNAALEHLIGTRTSGNYRKSPTVTLPFKHLVSKLTFAKILGPDGKELTSADIRFTDLPATGQLQTGTDETATAVFPWVETTPPGNDRVIVFPYQKTTNPTVYLPPLFFDTTSSDANGNFTVQTAGETYYGTLNGIKLQKSDGSYLPLSELKAGEHLIVTMYLNRGYGAGIGPYIVDWQYKPDNQAFGQIATGLYTAADLQQLLESINAGNGIPAAFLQDGTPTTIRLYQDIDLTGMSWTKGIGTVDHPFDGFTFDGQGYTITLPADASAPLFNQVGNATYNLAAPTILRDLTVKGGTPMTGPAMLAASASNVTLSDCHVSGGNLQMTISAGSETAVGALVGTIGGTSVVENCSSSDLSVALTGGSGQAGGLIGLVAENSAVSIRGCYAQSLVSIDGAAGQAGGLAGKLTAGSSMENCFFYADGNKGKVEGGEYDGALAGENGGTITNGYWGISSTSSLNAVGSPAGSSAMSGSSFLTSEHTQNEGSAAEVQMKTYPAHTFGSFTGSGTSATFTARPFPVSGTGGPIDCYGLLDALNAGSGATGTEWVWVYGKDYPVRKIE